MEKRSKIILILLVILLIAGFLRFYNLTMHDVITDEVFYGYRSIGLIDSLNSPFQPTPFEWNQQIPTWAKISFHDHPPLGFWIQHGFFSLFGVSLFTMRLPFVLAGMLSVLLVFLIGKELYQKPEVGLLAALVLSVSQNHIWISRIGLQESMLICFMLLAIWLFLKSLKHSKYFYWTVLGLGLAVLVKYTAVVLLPIFLIIWFWKKREYFSWKQMLLAGGLLILITSPIIIYNIGLFASRGHFDFQISYFLGQNVAEWSVRPGREVGDYGSRIVNLLSNMWETYGIGFSVFSIFALLIAFKRRNNLGFAFLLISICLLLLMFVFIGPQERFLTMLTPFLALILAGVFSTFERKKIIFLLLVFLLIVPEVLFSANTNLVERPYGEQGLHYSRLRLESNIWGYNQLEEYFQQLTKNKYPKDNFPVRFAFAEKLADQAKDSQQKSGKNPVQYLFVADSRIHGLSYLWYMTRHTVYERWPIIDESDFLGAISESDAFFTEQGFTKVIFIKAEDTLKKVDTTQSEIDSMEQYMTERNATQKQIWSADDRLSFLIYELSL